jgi:hypothetical protein
MDFSQKLILIILSNLFRTLRTHCMLKPYRCPRVEKILHNLFVIKDTNFYFFLDDSYASILLHIRKTLRYIYSVSQYYKNTKVMFFKRNLPSLILFLNSMLNYESNLYRSFLLILFLISGAFFTRISNCRGPFENSYLPNCT